MIDDDNRNTVNILITGSDGQLGREFRYLSGLITEEGLEAISDKKLIFLFSTRKSLDIKNKRKIAEYCLQNTINVIVNCAAYTAVDKAEQEQVQADAVNHLAVKNLAQVAKDQNIKLIHISTDYVFDGTAHKPYKETDVTNPQSVYGKSKLDGELAMQAINPSNSIIIRTSWLYSEYGNNFLKTMLRLGRERDEIGVVFDQIGAPTNARSLAKAILHIIPQLKNSHVEIYHYSNLGVCTWYDFASAIFAINNIDCKVIPIPAEAYPTAAKRPYYSVMDQDKVAEKFNVSNEHWRESLLLVNMM